MKASKFSQKTFILKRLRLRLRRSAAGPESARRPIQLEKEVPRIAADRDATVEAA